MHLSMDYICSRSKVIIVTFLEAMNFGKCNLQSKRGTYTEYDVDNIKTDMLADHLLFLYYIPATPRKHYRYLSFVVISLVFHGWTKSTYLGLRSPFTDVSTLDITLDIMIMVKQH